jgi:uncharacterized protein (TIGR03067 family)
MRKSMLTTAMLALAVVALADDVEPEPPGGKAALRKLKGTWVSVRMYAKGDEKPHEGVATYTFEGDKATYVYRNNPKRVMKFEAKRPDAFQVSQEDGKTPPTKYFFKVEKGELHLIVNRSKDPDAKADFSGKTMPVIVYKKQK